jgi:8-oxo-dGTP pyrophosphatase MutT (NUDIX family)
MAWIEDLANGVLLVRQAAGLKLWTLPGGKVKRDESLVRALKREVREETGLRVVRWFSFLRQNPLGVHFRLAAVELASYTPNLVFTLISF